MLLPIQFMSYPGI